MLRGIDCAPTRSVEKDLPITGYHDYSIGPKQDPLVLRVRRDKGAVELIRRINGVTTYVVGEYVAISSKNNQPFFYAQDPFVLMVRRHWGTSQLVGHTNRVANVMGEDTTIVGYND
jgi:hypothetical protein